MRTKRRQKRRLAAQRKVELPSSELPDPFSRHNRALVEHELMLVGPDAVERRGAWWVSFR